MTTGTLRDPAVDLARRLLGQPAFEVAWGGRRRLVSAATDFRGRATSVLGVPAFRWQARALRGLVAARSVVIQQALVGTEDGLSDWLPSKVRNLVPFDAVIGTPGSYQAVLVRLRCPRTGSLVAVVKVSVSTKSDATARIRNEIEAMRDAAVKAIVPDLLGEGEVDQHPFFVMRFVHGRTIGGSKADLRLAANVLSYQNEGKRTVPAAEHPFVRRVVAQFPGFPVDELPGELGAVRTHGDFAPWNMIVQSRGRIVVFDWEASEAEGVPFADMGHYLLSLERYINKKPAAVAVSRASHVISDLLNMSEEQSSVLVGLSAAARSIQVASACDDRAVGDPYWQDVVTAAVG